MFHWGDMCFGLSADDGPLVLVDRGFDELYELDLEYR